jgi:hypothetical protein
LVKTGAFQLSVVSKRATLWEAPALLEHIRKSLKRHTYHEDIEIKATQHYNKNVLLSAALCHYTEFLYAERYYQVENLHAECHHEALRHTAL